VIPGIVGQGFLRIPALFPKLTEDGAESSLGIESPYLPAAFSRHDSECRVLTTIVLPTYSVWALSDRICTGVDVSSRMGLPSLVPSN
jgi:hypothetical protein